MQERKEEFKPAQKPLRLTTGLTEQAFAAADKIEHPEGNFKIQY